MPKTTQFGNEDEIAAEGSLKPNTILMNRYKILGIVGGGGQGYVYNARDLNFEAKRFVAIKEMRYQASTDSSVRTVAFSTFQREANILATLTHPAIPKIYDIFQQNERAYLVMEFINGSDLEMLLHKTKELPMDKIIEWAIDLCDVLHYLHSHQPEPIIFRDVKPANIMVDSLGKARLIDFGIAKIFVSGVKNTMIGTEGYSAPEQYRGDVSPLSDIYGLGATLHHVITRTDPRLEQPFSFSERPLRNYNKDASEALQKVVDRALAMDPKERYATCEEMRKELISVRDGGSSATIKQAKAAAEGTSFFDDEEVDEIYGPRWTFATEDEIRGGVVVHDNKVFVGSYDTNLWAVDAETGDFVWKYATMGGVATTPVVDPSKGMVYFGSEDQTFYAVDIETGRPAWTKPTRGRIRSSPFLAHGYVFFGSDDGHLYALHSGSGRPVWSEGEIDLKAEVRTRPYVTNDLIIVGTELGELLGLELSGKRRWGVDLSKRARPISSSPVVDEQQGICYYGCFNGYLYAVDIESKGFKVWEFRTMKPIISSVAIDDTNVYFGSVDGNLYAVNAETSKEKWRFTTDSPIVATPVLHHDKLYFGGTDGIFYCLDTRNGRELHRYETGKPITGTPYIVGKQVIVGSMNYMIYAFPLIG